MATTYYIDSEWGGTQSGTEEEPYIHWNQLPAEADGDTYLFKRGSVFSDGVEWRLNSVTGITIDAYGDPADPKPLFENLVYSTNTLDWEDQTGNIWKLETEMSVRQWYILNLGTGTYRPRISTVPGIGVLGTLEANGDWDYIQGVTDTTNGYFLLYCDQNPITEWGSVSYNDYYQAAIQLNLVSGTVRNLRFTKTTCGLFVTAWTIGETSTVDISECEFDHCWTGIYMTGGDKLGSGSLGTHVNSVIHHNTIRNARAIGIRLSHDHEGTIVECNTVTNGGLQESSGAIYAGRCYATAASPVIIRYNIVDTYTYFNYWHDGDGIYADSAGEYIDVYGNIVLNLDREQGAGLRCNAGMIGNWYNNIVIGAAHGIEISKNLTNGTDYDGFNVYNNTLIDLTVGGWHIKAGMAVTDIINLANNCFVGNGAEYQGKISYATYPDLTASNNIYYGFDDDWAGIAIEGTDEQVVDPLLDAEQFPEEGSPCLSTGIPTLSSYDFHTRPHIGVGDHVGAKWPKLSSSSIRRET